MSGILKTIPYNQKTDSYYFIGLMDELDADVIMQYTGKLDKYGTEIFEYDIIKIYDRSSKEYIYVLVEYDEGSFYLSSSKTIGMHLWDQKGSDIEVVGNKFESEYLL